MYTSHIILKRLYKYNIHTYAMAKFANTTKFKW